MLPLQRVLFGPQSLSKSRTRFQDQTILNFVQKPINYVATSSIRYIANPKIKTDHCVFRRIEFRCLDPNFFLLLQRVRYIQVCDQQVF